MAPPLFMGCQSKRTVGNEIEYRSFGQNVQVLPMNQLPLANHVPCCFIDFTHTHTHTHTNKVQKVQTKLSIGAY